MPGAEGRREDAAFDELERIGTVEARGSARFNRRARFVRRDAQRVPHDCVLERE